MEKNLNNKIKGALFGLAVGDALGVPVEFKSREEIKMSPVSGMRAFGTWNQPAGTWSDDSSLAFCLAESLTHGYELKDIGQNFVKWMHSGFWGAHHKVFDIGLATRSAINHLARGVSPFQSGGIMEYDNGNGSLMRVMPLLFYIKDMPLFERYQITKDVSSLTHAHFRSVFSCFIYLEIAREILNDVPLENAYINMQQTVNSFATENEFDLKELQLFDRILKDNIKETKATTIESGGYVLHTLEAAIWCLLNTDNYTDAVLKAVNLGEDTDTTGCVTGGLAGLLYGYDEILEVWINAIARKDDIEDLCYRLYKNCSGLE